MMMFYSYCFDDVTL